MNDDQIVHTLERRATEVQVGPPPLAEMHGRAQAPPQPGSPS